MIPLHPIYLDESENLAWLHTDNELLQFSCLDWNWSDKAFGWFECLLCGLEIYQVQLNVFITEEKEIIN